MISRIYPDFDRAGFLAIALDGYEALELTPRARRISDALAQVLPSDRNEAIRLVVSALGPPTESNHLTGMDGFLYLPFVFFVADYGLDCFETSMKAQYELTKRFTAEFSLRFFIERHPRATFERLAEWATDPNVHVRRLVSEGTRSRLPWAPRLRTVQENPDPVLDLLELLKDDPEEYVRRSVANNLNDIAKDHPERVVEVAARWWVDAPPDRRRLVRHALRTLVKSGHRGALGVLGYGGESPIVLRGVTCTPETAQIGGKVRIEAHFENPSQGAGGGLVDFRVHFVKSNGTVRPKVFKGAELDLGAGESATVKKTLSLAQHTTRKHYPGSHSVEVLLNGVGHSVGGFELQ